MPCISTFPRFIILRTLALTYFDQWAKSRIMNTPKYHLQVLREFFDRNKIATIEELRAALGNPARCTIFRKLGEIEYLSSYSHRGKYYTLKSIARFTAQGLWRFRSVCFSRFGNLLETAEAFVQRSEAGYSAGELKEILGVKTKHALVQLVRDGRLKRENSLYLFFPGHGIGSPAAKSTKHSYESILGYPDCG